MKLSLFQTRMIDIIKVKSSLPRLLPFGVSFCNHTIFSINDQSVIGGTEPSD